MSVTPLSMHTHEYVSPEQAGARLDEMGSASDVYRFGATLFDLLTDQKAPRVLRSQTS